MLQLLDLLWGSVAERRMPTLSIIEHLDVLEDAANGLGSRSILLSPDAFDLQRPVEALVHGIVIAVAATAHTWLCSPVGQHLLKSGTAL